GVVLQHELLLDSQDPPSLLDEGLSLLEVPFHRALEVREAFGVLVLAGAVKLLHEVECSESGLAEGAPLPLEHLSCRALPASLEDVRVEDLQRLVDGRAECQAVGLGDPLKAERVAVVVLASAEEVAISS